MELTVGGCDLCVPEESGSMGLPLGIEYERKKQKLQQELRMDYRHYMAQVTSRLDLLPRVFQRCAFDVLASWQCPIVLQKKQFSETGPLTHLENWSSVKVK